MSLESGASTAMYLMSPEGRLLSIKSETGKFAD